jgi:hypothetical protein
MGYSHSWGFLPDGSLFQAVFPHISADASLILRHLEFQGIRIAGPLGRGKPILTDSRIAFNGADPNAADTFHLSTEPAPCHRLQSESGRWFSWAFCKTNRLPYDLAVMAVLLRAHHHAPEQFALHATGEWDRDWQPARALVEGIFETTIPANPLGDASRGPAAAQLAARAPRSLSPSKH